VLILFAERVAPATQGLTCFVELYFGVVNVITWRLFTSQSCWMAVLHLPLLVLSIYGMILVKTLKHSVTELSGQPA